ncbi:hypothetical protein V1514DRAFT_368914 [Lipomyces japonicus]|uniref:uncharacterized protein n=1 Tax=Lipomyces japonicus TaxID=56871 RepID=UPI0034CEBE26
MFVRSLGFVALALLAAVVAPVAGIFNDEAFTIDWQIEALGGLAPQRSVLAGGITTDALTVFSDSAILASLNQSNGALLWRHDLASSALVSHAQLVRFDLGSVLLAAATPKDPAISHVAVFAEDSGYLQWEAYLPGGAPVSVDVQTDAFVLLSDGVAVKLRHRTGALAWQFKLAHGILPVQIVQTNAGVAVVARSPSEGLGYYLLDADSGLPVRSFAVLDTNSAAILVNKLSPSAKHFYLTWSLPLESNTFKVAALGKVPTVQTIFTTAQYATLSTHAIPGQAKFIASIVGTDGNTWSETYEAGDDQFSLVTATKSESGALSVSSDGEIFRLTSTQLKFPRGNKHADAVFISEVQSFICNKQSCLIGTVGGDYSFFTQRYGHAWTRDESLALIVDAVFVDLQEEGEKLSIGQVLFEEHAPALEAYIHRVKRHVHALTNLPRYVANFVQRFSSGNYDVVPQDVGSPVGDAFGFRKFIVAATKYGGLVALDTVHGGQKAWKISAVLNGDVIVGISKNDDKNGQIYVVGEKGSIALIDAIHGEVLGLRKIRDIGLGDKVKSIVRFKEDDIAYIAAWTAHGDLHFLGESSPANPVYFSAVEGNFVKGFLFKQNKAVSTWTFTLPGDYKISSYGVRDQDDIIVSVGRVLGDRSVLYKYLNPQLLAVSAVDESTQSAAVFLIDRVSGRVLHSVFHNNEVVDVNAGVKLVVGEHWVVYSYWSEQPSRGEKIVVLDLYESDIHNQRWSKNIDFSSFNDTPAPYVQAQSFLLPTRITSLAVSRSRFGITTRDIIASLDTNQIVVLPKRILDGRRPVNRNPSKDEAEEGLFKYEPLVGDDRRITISHVRNVIGTKKIICHPALLESTVLVFSYGLDSFFTRITPSQPFDLLSKSFNKGQLVLTIVALAAALKFISPLVERKKINQRWGADS